LRYLLPQLHDRVGCIVLATPVEVSDACRMVQKLDNSPCKPAPERLHVLIRPMVAPRWRVLRMPHTGIHAVMRKSGFRSANTIVSEDRSGWEPEYQGQIRGCSASFAVISSSGRLVGFDSPMQVLIPFCTNEVDFALGNFRQQN